MFKSLQPTPQTYSVIWTNDAFSKTAAEGVRLSCDAAGLKRIDGFELPAKPTDVSSVLASVRAKTPDMLVCVMHDQDSLLMARQMVATNTNVKLLFQGLGPQLASFREALGKYSEYLCSRPTGTRTCRTRTSSSAIPRSSPTYYKQQVHAADRLPCRRRGGLHRDLRAGDAGGQEHQARGGARRAGRGRLRDLLQPHQVHADGDGDPLLMGGMIGQVQKGKLEIVFPADAASGKAMYPAPPWDKKA